MREFHSRGVSGPMRPDGTFGEGLTDNITIKELNEYIY